MTHDSNYQTFCCLLQNAQLKHRYEIKVTRESFDPPGTIEKSTNESFMVLKEKICQGSESVKYDLE